MAIIRGKESLAKDYNLIVEMHNEKGKSDRGQYITVQIDQSLLNPEKVAKGEVNPNYPAQTNAFLNSMENAMDKTKTDHGFFYQNSQIDAIIKGAGDKVVDLGDRKLYGINAQLVPASNKNGFAIKSVNGATKNKQFGKDTLEKQAEVARAAKEFYTKDPEGYKAQFPTSVKSMQAKEREAEAKAKQVETAKEAEADEFQM